MWLPEDLEILLSNMVVTKKQDFLPIINIQHTQSKTIKNILSMNDNSTKSATVVLLKSIKNRRNFVVVFSLVNFNLEDQFLWRTFFSSVNFWTTWLLKSRPIFEKLIFIDRIFRIYFLQVCWFLVKYLGF